MDAAAGAISISEDVLRTMLSYCKYWQTFGGASYTQAQALARIYQQSMPLLGDIIADPTSRPFAIIYKEGGVKWDGIASPNMFAPGGRFSIEFHKTPPTLDSGDPGDMERELKNDIGRIVSTGDVSNPGLVELSNTGTYMQLLSITEDGPYRTAPEFVATIGDALVHYLDVEWGHRR